MKYAFQVLIIPVVFVALQCCTPRNDMVAVEPVAPVVKTTSNGLKPPSELALLMRKLAAHADSVKAAVGRGDDLPPYPQEAKTLFSATPTEGMHIDPITYPTFGNDYLEKLDALYEATKKGRSAAYNAVVQGCANCHSTHCPGPMMRIRKMYVPLGDQ